MVSFEFIGLVLTGLSISASILYYANVLRNQTRTRNAQLFMNLYQTIISEDFNQRFIEMLGAEWKDYEDYLAKYGPIDNPNVAARRFSTWQVYNGIGFLLMEKYVELGKVEQLFGGHGPSMLWNKWEPIILDLRSRLESPSYMLGFEYLANSIEESRKKQGFTTIKSFKDLKP